MLVTILAIVSCRDAERKTPATAGQAAPVDSFELAKYLGRDGTAFVQTLAAEGTYLAVLGRRERSFVLFAFTRLADTLVLLTRTNAGEFAPRSASWFNDEARPLRGLVVTWDNRVEGAIETRVLVLRQGSLQQTYRDSGLICRPAEVRNLGRGDVAIVTFPDDPSTGDCGDPCHAELASRGFQPSRIRLLVWSGEKWIESQTSRRAFFDSIAATHAAAAAWVASPQSGSCNQVGWLENGQLFLRLAEETSKQANRNN